MQVLTVFLGLAGIAGVVARLRREFSPGVIATAVALIAGATPLTWYIVLEPAPLDVAAFALVAWVGVAVVRDTQAERKAGAVTIGRWILLFAIPLTAVWWRVLGDGGFDPSTSRWADVLFSSRYGLLSWTPAVYFCVVGTLMYVRRDRMWTIAALVVLVAAAWVVGSSDLWRLNPAAAARPLVATLALLAPGLAHLVEVVRRRPLVALVPLVALPLVWNYLLMVQYTIGLLPKDEPISFGRMVRQQGDLQVRTVPWYPFSFPANVWFAWREGMPIDRYDTLGMEPPVPAIDLTLDRNAERYLLEGWSGPTAEGEGQGWWIGEREASVALPLSVGSSRSLRLMIVARSRFEEPSFEADLAVLVNGHEAGTFSPPATHSGEVDFTVPASAWREGLNRISIVSRGTRRVDPSDPRPPGPVARRAATSAWPVAVYRISVTPL